MSIPLVQNNEKDSINTSIIAIKRNIERINMLLGLSNSEEIDTSKFATKEELQQAVTDLQPVDEVAVDNMQSVTSNAVFLASSPNYANKKLIFDGLTHYENNAYVAPDNGIIIACGWGTVQENNFIILKVDDVVVENQGYGDEAISATMPVRKGDIVEIRVYLASKNYGCYFVPCV
jgi:hypothetical protein